MSWAVAEGKQAVMEDLKPRTEELGFGLGSAEHPKLCFGWGQIRGEWEGLLGPGDNCLREEERRAQCMAWCLVPWCLVPICMVSVNHPTVFSWASLSHLTNKETEAQSWPEVSLRLMYIGVGDPDVWGGVRAQA